MNGAPPMVEPQQPSRTVLMCPYPQNAVFNARKGAFPYDAPTGNASNAGLRVNLRTAASLFGELLTPKHSTRMPGPDRYQSR